MILNKLARWAGVTAFSAIIPAAALAATHHTRLSSPTTAPSRLTAKHIKPTAGKKAVATKLVTHSIKSRQLKAVKPKATALKSRHTTAGKLVTHKSTASKLTATKHVASKLVTIKSKGHTLATHKPAAKPVKTVAPTM